MGWLVDIREPQELINYFISKGGKADKLHVGDYSYNELVGFERKSSDFMDFTRMLSQIDELVDNYTFPFLVVEKSLLDIIQEANKIYNKNMLPNILGVVASLCVRGCPPIFCGSQATMLIIMEKLAEKSLDGKERGMKRILRTQHFDAEDKAVNILRGFGFGITKAEDISAKYKGNVMEILEVILHRPEEFKTIYGIGGGTIDELKATLASKGGAIVKPKEKETTENIDLTEQPF
jgi:ERCC4-type nuclease